VQLTTARTRRPPHRPARGIEAGLRNPLGQGKGAASHTADSLGSSGSAPATPARASPPFQRRADPGLLEVAWWHWPLERVRAHAELLCSTDVDAFLAAARDGPRKGLTGALAQA
jgi:hypothetical protein